MPEPLRVDLADLVLSSNQLAMHAADHVAVHAAANNKIQSANAGWIGASANALADKLSQLLGITSHISDELSRHRDAFHHSANLYRGTDRESADDLEGEPFDGNHAS